MTKYKTLTEYLDNLFDPGEDHLTPTQKDFVNFVAKKIAEETIKFILPDFGNSNIYSDSEWSDAIISVEERAKEWLGNKP